MYILPVFFGLLASTLALAIPDVTQKEGRFERDCNGRCGSVYGFSGPDFLYCLDECRVGGQRLLQDKTKAPIAVSAKTARSYDSCVNDYCYYLSFAPPAYGGCLATCYFRGRRAIIDPLDTVSIAMEPFAGEKVAKSSGTLEETEDKIITAPVSIGQGFAGKIEDTPGKISGVVDAVTDTDFKKVGGADADKRKARCFHDAFHPSRRVVTYDTYYKGPYVKVLLWG